MKISKDCHVTLKYKLLDDNGRQLDDSEQTGPMSYVQGAEDILQGIEDAVEGHKVGDKVKATIAATEAYGDFDPSKITILPLAAFAGIDNLHQGMQIQEETKDGPILVTIKEITDQEVTVDTNHPLAGQALHFELQVSAIRKATDKELHKAHVHH